MGRLDNIPQGWGGAAGVTYMGGGTTQLEKAVPWTWECQLKNQLWEQGGGAWRCWLPWTSVEDICAVQAVSRTCETFVNDVGILSI